MQNRLLQKSIKHISFYLAFALSVHPGGHVDMCMQSEYEYIQNNCTSWVLYWWSIFMIFLVSNEFFFCESYSLGSCQGCLGLSLLSVLLLSIVSDLGNVFQWTTFSVVTAFYPLLYLWYMRIHCYKIFVQSQNVAPKYNRTM